MTHSDPFHGRIVPPAPPFQKFLFYCRRYGLLPTLIKLASRKVPRLWSMFGPYFSRSVIKLWLKDAAPRILNLGGGSNLHTRWLTADVDPRADVFVDLMKPLPFPSSSIDVVYLEEVIEHLPYDRGLALLKEVCRVLRDNGEGWVRLTTPCLDEYVRQLTRGHINAATFNAIFYEHGHRFIYDRVTLENALRDAGFVDVRFSSFREQKSKFGHFDTHPLRFPIYDPQLAMFIEARAAPRKRG